MKETSKGWVRIYTYKEGLLARAAHDLQLSCTRFRVCVDDQQVTARFFPESFQVDGALQRGVLLVDELSESDRRQILKNVKEEILRCSRFPEIVFRGQGASRERGYRASGELELVGKSCPLELSIERFGEELRGEVELRPSRWGIAPFKALMGAIRLQDRIKVAFGISAEVAS